MPSEQAVTLLRNGEVAALSYRWLNRTILIHPGTISTRWGSTCQIIHLISYDGQVS